MEISLVDLHSRQRFLAKGEGKLCTAQVKLVCGLQALLRYLRLLKGIIDPARGLNAFWITAPIDLAERKALRETKQA